MPTYSEYSSVVSATTLRDLASPSPDLHVYMHAPTPIFRARVAMPGTITYPVTDLIFDGVTLGVFGDIQPDQTLILGTTEDGDDLGRVRVRTLATSTAIPLGRVSQGYEDGTLQVIDNAFVSILEDYRVWAKLPYLNTETNIDYKDNAVPVGDYNVLIPPVAIMGAAFADYIDPVTGKITVTFDSSGSYTMADGASIVSRQWDVQDGTIITGTSTSVSITVEFEAGFRYVVLSVVDSNDRGHTTRRPVLAVDPDADVTIDNSKCQITQRLTQNGQTVDIQMFADLARTGWPDGCLVMVWDGSPTGPDDRSNIRFVGWHQSDSWAIRATKTGLARDTVLRCVDVAGRLDVLPGFNQQLVFEQTEDDEPLQWSLMPGLTINKALHYLLFWHSTAIDVADFFLPAVGDDYPTVSLIMNGQTLYDQVNSLAGQTKPDHILFCNRLGQLTVVPDWMLMDVEDRPPIALLITEDDYTDIGSDYTRPPRVHVLRAGAVVCSTDWIVVKGVDTVPLAFSIAPGDTFSQGTSEQQENEGLTQSQAQLNAVTGHRYARLNARFGTVRLKLASADLASGSLWHYEPASMQRAQLDIASAYAAQRGLPFTSVNVMVKEMNVRYATSKTGTAIDAEMVVEFEVSGLPGVTVIPEEAAPADDYETPPPPEPVTPPDDGLVEGVEDVAGISTLGFVYRTADFQAPSPTWDEVDLGVGAIYSFVVDPFSPGYITGSGSIDGWVVGETDIYRVTDLFGTPDAVSVFTFAVANDMAEFHWRTIQASFGAYFADGSNPWLLCVSYYADLTGHEGTWATYSVDGGVTWAAEVEVSAFFGGAQTRFNPIGVYASPKTPGLGVTVAYGAEEDEDNPLPAWGAGNASGSVPPVALGTAGSWAVSSASSSNDGDPSPFAEDNFSLVLAPPETAVRVEVTVQWAAAKDQSSTTFAGTDISFSTSFDPTTTNRAGAPSFDEPLPPSSSTTGSYTLTFTRQGDESDWGGGVDDLDAEILGTSKYIRWLGTTRADSQLGATATAILEVRVTVTEIELEGGHIYTPSPNGNISYKTLDYGATWAADAAFINAGDGQGGSIHVPWPDNASESIVYHGRADFSANRQYRLYRSGVDISPSDDGVSYGVQSLEFGVRTHDSNRQYALVAGIGNDTSADAGDDVHAIFASSDGGDSWQLTLGPTADSEAPAGRPIYHAAFGGGATEQNIIFLWGAENYIAYSDDLGSSLSDKSGNLSSFGSVYLTGIAGGPTG